MCGIIAATGDVDLSAAVAALRHRGPDFQHAGTYGGCSLGHTGVAIQGPGPRSPQPCYAGPVTVAYNGELFNGPAIRSCVDDRAPYSWQTTGDTETIAAALAVLGPEIALPNLDGMFAVAWADERDPGGLHLARDRLGEVPLHVHGGGQHTFAASELKAFRALGLRHLGPAVMDIGAGQHWRCGPGGSLRMSPFAGIPAGQVYALPHDARWRRLRALLGQAVQRRLISDVPVCTLLSGGIDSAVIAYELAQRVPDLHAYTAVMDPKSADVRAARETADAIGVKLTEVPVPAPSADDMAAVVRQIELPLKAQVEIGWPCLALARQISSDGFKVTYSGEGADELWGSYGFAYHAIKRHGFTAARRQLVAKQARANFIRVNKSFASAGTEARLPWLDPDLVAFCLGCSQIDATLAGAHPKGLLIAAYSGLLPDRVLRRPKLAFQDGLGIKDVIGAQLPDPGRFYRAEFTRVYG